METLLTNTYYGNTIQDWLIASTIIVSSIVFAKLLYWTFSKVIRLFTAKTKTELDDIIVDMVEEPAIFIVICAGVWFGINFLTLPEAWSTFIGRIYQVIIALLIGWMLSRTFKALYKQYMLPLADKTDSDLDDQLLPVVSKGVSAIIWSMSIIIGLNNAGYDVAALIAGLGIGGLALAMAAKDTVSNIFGGVTIFTDKPFTMNERIKVAGYDGTVEEIGIRSTRLKTLEGRTVTIPNSTFADEPVENISWEPARKVKIDLGLTYNTTPEKMERAMEILATINTENPNTNAKTTIAFNAFGDSAMNIMFIYYITKNADIANTQTAINMAILRGFNAEGLEFAYPSQTLYNINQTK